MKEKTRCVNRKIVYKTAKKWRKTKIKEILKFVGSLFMIFFVKMVSKKISNILYNFAVTKTYISQ